MKKWYLIDDCLHGARQVFETALDCDAQEEAFDLATREWEALSAHDQRSRDDFYIGFADVDDNGCVDYNTMTDIISIKKGEKPVKKYDFSFEAGQGLHASGGVNYMCCPDLHPDIYAEIEVPDGASDDYGYLFLKQEIIKQASAAGIDRSQLVFWYDDGQEDKLSPDASAGLLWYAVQQDPSDDWSTGSYDRDEAAQMARAQLADYPDTLIAVIDKSTSNPVCVDEIRDF